MTEQPTTTGSWVDAWAARIGAMPRMARVVLSLFFALALTVLVFVALDQLIFDAAVEGGSSLTMLTVITLVFGVVVYVVEWWALVGFESDDGEEWRAGPAAVWGMLAGFVGVLILVIVFAAMVASL